MQFEDRLKDYLRVSNLISTNNGTNALMIALELLEMDEGDEVITTPFTFVATVSSIVWQRYRPVFADIDPHTFNISPESINEKISDRSKAILPVHVFGNPCDVESIDEIGKEHSLKIIYDASHTFGVRLLDKELYAYGNVSTLSFHATKVFHTIEGGAIIGPEKNLIDRARMISIFGMNDDDDRTINEVGINAKMNEFQAIMGLLNLKDLHERHSHREDLYNRYLNELNGLGLQFQQLSPDLLEYNYIYFPILLRDVKETEFLIEELKKAEILPKRYFYPLISDMEPFRIFYSDTPVASSVSKRIVCLPLHGSLSLEDQSKVIEIIRCNL